MTEEKVRVAMIGAGSMANQVHYPSLASFDDVEIAAICDVDTDRLNTTADKYGVEKRYTDYRRMVDEVTPDAAYAIGQPNIMFDIWLWCLGEGLNLFIEKPMGLTLHQAQMLAHAARVNGCITQVGFQRRTCPIAVKLRDACLERGPIVHAVCEFYKCMQQPFFDAGGLLVSDGIHAVDTVRWMCGGEVTGVHSICRRVGVPDINFVATLIEFDNGSTGVMLTNWASGRRTFRIEMHAPGICADVDLEGKGHLYADGDTEGTTFDTREVSGGDEFFIFGGFQAKSREFINCLKSGGQPGSNFADAVKTMELAERILALSLLEEKSWRT